MARLETYRPRGVQIPEEAAVERTFEGDPGKEAMPRFDRRTVLCDVFLSHCRDQLLCIGPPLLNLGVPETVTLRGGIRRFAVEEPPLPMKRASLLRIGLEAGDLRAMEAGGMDLQLRFPEFRLDVRVAPRAVVPRKRVSLTLSTLQQDNDPQWLRDWCTWHHRTHGVERVVLYDNGSRNADEVYAELARRTGDFELVVVHWNYPYGPATPFHLHYAQTVALNHCRLMFGPWTRWCINLDVDEYLYSNCRWPLASQLDRTADAAVYLSSYIVPAVAGESTGRCFDSSWRSRDIEPTQGRKYIYRPERALFSENHEFVPKRIGFRADVRHRFVKVLSALGMEAIVRGLVAAKRELRRAMAVFRGYGAGEPALFFYHFRALNTGWKFPRTFIPADPEVFFRDERIGAMRLVVEDGNSRDAARAPGSGRPTRSP